jgi:predicted RNA-binding protein with PUA-like domain
MARHKSNDRETLPQRNFWLMKSEPDCFPISALAEARQQTTFWDGVRNYQARNFLRDSIKLGDGVLFYHSNTDPLAIVGTAEVVREGYPDHTAFDPACDHYDPKSSPDSPTWYMVDIRLVQVFDTPVTRQSMLADPRLGEMMVLQRGSRLSVQPVTAAEWAIVHELAGASVKPGRGS